MPPKKSKTSSPATAAKKSSMYELYQSLYREHSAKYGPRTAILLMVGKFYELYDLEHVETFETKGNVKELIDVCGGSQEEPKLTDDPKWIRITWGFPESSYPKYEKILIRAGYTVIRYDQEKNAIGEIVGRELQSVSSPGTYIDSEGVTEDRNIVAISISSFTDRYDKLYWQIASTAFDVSTGHCVSTQNTVSIIDGKPVMDKLEPFWSVYPPTEVVAWIEDIPTLSESHIRSWFSGYRGLIHMYATESETAAVQRGRLEFLRRIYNPATALSISEFLDLQHCDESLQNLARLLEFVNDHNPSYLENLRDHRVWSPDEELLLGNNALEQLSMISNIKPNECLMHWIQKAYTALGRRTLRQRILKPITDIEELEIRQTRIEEMRSMVSSSLDRNLRGIQDLDRIFRKFQIGKGSASDLIQILKSYEKILILFDVLNSSSSKMENEEEMRNHIQKCLERWDASRIKSCTSDHVLGIVPHHPWNRGIHASMDRFEDEWSELQTKVEQLKHEWNLLLSEEDAIKIEWSEDSPFTFSATKRRATNLATLLKQRKKINLDVHTKGSSSISTLDSPQIQELNEAARRIWTIWKTEATELWNQDWKMFEYPKELLDWVGQVDTEITLARISEEYGYTRPQYVESEESAGIAVKDLRHPILERIHTATSYIPHSIELGCLVSETSTAAKAENGILLYGVNAAGKSSLSKAIGLGVLMAQCGMPVPATEMRISPYNALFTRILGNDNMWAGMSSFVVEMTEFRSILRSAGPKTLVLGDELCAGTETESAIAIVASGILTLVDKKTQFVFATHLHELMNMSEITDLTTVKPYHLTVHSDSRSGGKLIYDRLLKEGSGSPMYGLEVCRGLDMDADFLRRAIDIRKKLENTPTIGKQSRYNAAVPVQACNVCGATDMLETHHIVPQAEADKKGRIGVGKHKNDVSNLVVVCETCHNKHHSGNLSIDGWAQSTSGRLLKYAYNPKAK